MMLNTSAFQSKSASLAGMFYIPQLQGCKPCQQYPKHFGDSHSAKESAQCGGSEHRLNICPMFESHIAGIPTSKQYRNWDPYGEFTGDVLTSQDIKKQSTKKCFGQKAGKKKGSIASATLSTTANGYQPFGSIPRDCNSLRRTRLIHVARDESPSLRISSSSCDRNSCANRNWYWSVLGLSVDIVITYPISSITDCNYNVIACCLQSNKKTMPRSAPTLTGHLTTTDSIIIEEAVKENTTPAQGRHSLNLNSGNEQTSFVWIIAAIRRDSQTIKATLHHIAAPTEREARLSLVKDHVCFFAGRINQAVSHV